VGRPRVREIEPPNPSGLCMCGCGDTTPVSKGTDTAAGRIAGEHIRYVFGHKPVARMPNLDHPLLQDAWLAGFTDGEGCFFVGSPGRRARVGFTTALRADDGAILEEIQAALGGSLGRIAGRGNQKPKKQLTLYAPINLRAAVAYFERFPLRAKKAADFEVWKHAVAVAASKPGDERDAALTYLQHQLREARRYR
jgi:hypothetical protein